MDSDCFDEPSVDELVPPHEGSEVPLHVSDDDEFDIDAYFNEDFEIADQLDDEAADDEYEYDFDEPVEQPVTSVPLVQQAASSTGVVTGAAWNNMLSHAFSMGANVADCLPFPWETGTMKSVFSNNVMPRLLPSTMDSTDLRALNEANAGSILPVEHEDTSLGPQPAYLSAVKSLKDMDYMDGKRAQMTLAASKWMDILSIDWRSSSTGEQIRNDLQMDPGGDLAEQTLKAVFGVKSPSTILKRVASMRQYIVWHQKDCSDRDRYVSPFPMFESDVWNYFLHLRSVRRACSKGYTVSTTFLETIRFCKHVMGFHGCDDILQSKRLAGFAALEKKEKGPLNQAPSLEVEHLQRLHHVLAHGACLVDRIGAGAFLCAIYARARWSDLRYIHHIKYDGFKRNSTMDLYTTEHKTSSAGLKREQFMPLVVVSEGIVQGDWLGLFIAACHEAGFNWEKVPYGPMLPAPREDGVLYRLQRPQLG